MDRSQNSMPMVHFPNLAQRRRWNKAWVTLLQESTSWNRKFENSSMTLAEKQGTNKQTTEFGGRKSNEYRKKTAFL